MDPITGVGLASSSIQLASFVFSLISGTRSIYRSASGASHHNETIETIVTQLQTLSFQVSSSAASSHSLVDRSIAESAAWCTNTAQELFHLLAELRRGDKSVWKSFRAAIKSARNGERVDDLFESIGRMQDVDGAAPICDLQSRMSETLRRIDETTERIEVENADSLMGIRDSTLEAIRKSGTGIKAILEKNLPSNQADHTKDIPTLVDNFRLGYEKGLVIIFWIRGKAGSGKSTLMKYLSQNPHALELLRTWAGDRDLSIGRYFFCSFELVPMRFQSYAKSISELPPEPGRWAMSELMRATKSFVACSLQKRFCIFIDGLDEHDGDMDDLIELIEQLASSENIKICCSSRPWPSLADAFGQKENSMLKLEDLTAGDIRKFVAASFQQHKRFSKYARDNRFSTLMEEIARKAEGVCFWVTLVVKSLRDGLTNADRIVDLERRLKAMPLDLEALLWRMIKSIDPFYKRKSSELLLTIGHRTNGNIPAFLLDILDELDDNPEALANGVSCEILGDPADWVDTMNRKLDARTKGLVELRCESWPRANAIQPSQIRRNSSTLLQVLHRSVLDFLSTPKVVQELVRDCRPGFKPHEQILAGYLIWLLSPTIPLADPFYSSDSRDDDFKLSGFFESVTNFEGKHPRDGALVRYFRIASQRRPVVEWSLAVGPRRPQSFLSMAVMDGSTLYLHEALREDPGLVIEDDRQSGFSVLFMAIFSPTSSRHICSKTVKAILRHGANLSRLEGGSGFTAWSILLECFQGANTRDQQRSLIGSIGVFRLQHSDFASYKEMKEIFASLISHGADMSDQNAEPVIRKLFNHQDAEELLSLTPPLKQVYSQLEQEGPCSESDVH
ncbi:hypothetical protein QBC37DRAFT_488098 [Rhypophila decipiens]|uniref:NACHT domain-containing protein n=1 Tax=Rhypophila decipiens TaxID=261697 RepID=A0AAN6XT95_9PEZI|nr:hypothetical protein QBC37DRAFT_488098 [Rhypophila decipiens]